MITDPIADMLTRLRNAQQIGHRAVTVRGSRMIGWILDVLKREGFIENYKEKTVADKPGVHFDVQLRYNSQREPVISTARRVSTPGRRMYSRVTRLPHIHRGLGIAILSTSQGIMSDREARKKRVGGELIAYIS